MLSQNTKAWNISNVLNIVVKIVFTTVLTLKKVLIITATKLQMHSKFPKIVVSASHSISDIWTYR